MLTVRDEIFRLYPLHAQRIFEEMERQATMGVHTADPDSRRREDEIWLNSELEKDSVRAQDILWATFFFSYSEEGSEYWQRLAGTW